MPTDPRQGGSVGTNALLCRCDYLPSAGPAVASGPRTGLSVAAAQGFSIVEAARHCICPLAVRAGDRRMTACGSVAIAPPGEPLPERYLPKTAARADQIGRSTQFDKAWQGLELAPIAEAPRVSARGTHGNEKGSGQSAANAPNPNLVFMPHGIGNVPVGTRIGPSIRFNSTYGNPRYRR